MPKYLRSITKKRWDTYPDADWLKPDELKGDVLKDLATSDGDLSIWEISEEFGIDGICTALAAKRDSVKAFDYVIFDEVELQSFGFEVIESLGDTPYDALNNFHRDIKSLTVDNLTALAYVLSNCHKDRILPKDLKSKLVDGLTSGRLSRQPFFNKRLLEKLDGT